MNWDDSLLYGLPQGVAGTVLPASGIFGQRGAPQSATEMSAPAPIDLSQPYNGGVFGQGGPGRAVAGVLGPALLAAGGNTSLANSFIQADAERSKQYAILQRQLALARSRSAYGQPTNIPINPSAGLV